MESIAVPRLQRLKLSAGDDPESVARSLERRPGVTYAEPNRIYRAAAIPTDPLLGQQWALGNDGRRVNGFSGTPGADIDAAGAWETTSGSEAVTVAVVDTGVRFDHPDLAASIIEDPVTGLHGHDWVDGGEPFDGDGHGTFVAGIIAAQANNGRGIAGIAPRAKLLVLRVLDDSGDGTADDVAEAFAYAGRQGVEIVNASLGGVGSQAVADAILESPATLFVVAAGNDGEDIDSDRAGDQFPCEDRSDNVVCVGATDQNDGLAAFSNRGDASVDLAAPGVEILSTHPELRTLFYDDFESDTAGRWITGIEGEPWAGTTSFWKSPTHGLSDSPSGPYRGLGRAVAQINGKLDLRGMTHCVLEYFARFDRDTPFGHDQAFVEDLQDAERNWWPVDRSYIGAPRNYRVPLGAAITELRFVLEKHGGGTPGEGVDIDDVAVRCLAPDGGPEGYRFLSGTSAAAPQASGVAALMLARNPGASADEVKNALLDGADRLPSLEGQTVSGGRLNARGSLNVALRKTPPVPVGNISTVAGGGRPYTPGPPHWGVPATSATLYRPFSVERTRDGGFLIADTFHHRVWKADSQGFIRVFAGTGEPGFSGDGGHALLAKLNRPFDVSETANGGVLIADAVNGRIRLVAPDGTIRTVASTEPATGVAAMRDGRFAVSEQDAGTIRVVSPNGSATTVAGPYCPAGTCWVGPVSATRDGDLLFAEGNVIRRWSPDGGVKVVAGNGERGWGGEHRPATAVRMAPYDVSAAPDGGFLVTEFENGTVRRIAPNGVITTVAGRLPQGIGGDGGTALAARFYFPQGVSATLGPGFLVADTENHLIRYVDRYPQGPSPEVEPSPGGGGGGAGGGGGSSAGAGVPGGNPPAGQPGFGPALPPGIKQKAAGASMRLMGKRHRVNRRSGVRVSIDCPARCSFRTVLSLSPRAVRRLGLGRKGIQVGRVKGTLAAGQSREVTTKVSRRVLRALRHRRSVRAKLAVEIESAGGAALRREAVVVLILRSG